MIKKLLLACVILIALIACKQPSLDGLLDRWNDHEVPYVEPQELAALLENNHIVIMDVREWEEFKVSHLPNADWAGYKNFEPEHTLRHYPDKNTPIVFYCSLGIRSEQIGEQFQELGYTKIMNLYGGIIEWKNSGQQVHNLSAKSTDSVHTYSKRYSGYLTNGTAVYD